MNFSIRTDIPPTVEIDVVSHSAYIRFRKGKVAKTVPLRGAGIITADLDKEGGILGIEFLGVREFNITNLLKKTTGVEADVPLERTRYVGASTKPGELQPT